MFQLFIFFLTGTVTWLSGTEVQIFLSTYQPMQAEGKVGGGMGIRPLSAIERRSRERIKNPLI